MSKIEKALVFAVIHHQGQYRKGTKIPYIVHPVEVMSVLIENGADEDAVVAGILHDVVEDTSATLGDIKKEFGENIAKIIDFESENKGLPYRVRKKEHMDRLAKAPLNAQFVNLADKYSNIKGLAENAKKFGEEYWNNFNGSKEDICWYYNYALESLSALSQTDLYIKTHIIFTNLFEKEKQKTDERIL